MPSPFIRRRRLADTMRALRERQGLTTDELAERIYRSRSCVSKLENARGRSDVGDVMKIMDVLGITGDQWDELVTLAREAAERGWWDKYGNSMGYRQRMYADLEYNAATIRGYYQYAFPGVLQTPEFTEALIDLDKAAGPLIYKPDRMVKARQHRQAMALRPDGPSCDFILDEFVIRRLAVPTQIMVGQLRHLASTVSSAPRLSVQVLPVNARTEGDPPRSTFTIYTFQERSDPPVAVADTFSTDVVNTAPSEVRRYEEMFERLREVAISSVKSLTFLEDAADELADLAGS
ncbi:helix-turn-helix domain-containing protein [Actinomadura adrarensis]|uniref:Helix-turn-helix domain-containing protein n=1 Tax=Actinomadura adrarensis TaxID=1819600 RepID=A0ABW3CQ62_9ACTN